MPKLRRLFNLILMHSVFSFFSKVSATIVIALFLSHPAKSLTVDSKLNDTLLLVSRDSVLAVDSLPEFANLGKYCSPFRGNVISHFGPRRKRFHAGTDIKLELGDTVRAAFTGVVTRSSKYYGYGLLVVLRHNESVETYYSHLSKLLVKVGDTIKVGSAVGLGGRTGRATTEHLHFEFRVNKIAFDSEKLFDFKNHRLLANAIPTVDTVKISVATTDLTPNYDNSVTPNLNNLTQMLNNDTIHTVKKNDTLYSLAKHYGTSIDSICIKNRINPNDILRLGQKLKIR